MIKKKAGTTNSGEGDSYCSEVAGVTVSYSCWEHGYISMKYDKVGKPDELVELS